MRRGETSQSRNSPEENRMSRPISDPISAAQKASINLDATSDLPFGSKSHRGKQASRDRLIRERPNLPISKENGEGEKIPCHPLLSGGAERRGATVSPKKAKSAVTNLHIRSYLYVRPNFRSPAPPSRISQSSHPPLPLIGGSAQLPLLLRSRPVRSSPIPSKVMEGSPPRLLAPVG